MTVNSAKSGLQGVLSVSDQGWQERVDLALCVCVCAYALFAIALGFEHNQTGLALLVAVPLVVTGVAAYMVAAGQFFNMAIYPALLMMLVALHIQLGVGRIEYHFGVFLSLGILLAYRHWLPIVIGAGLIAVHHLAFDSMQRMGFPVYCMTQPGLATVFLHAGYVVAQSAVEIVIAHAMHKAARETSELQEVVRRLRADDRIDLRAASAATQTPAAQQLCGALTALDGVLQAVRGAATQISSAASDVGQGSIELGDRSAQSAGSVRDSVKLIQSINSAVNASTESAQQAFQLATEASETANEGSRVMNQMTETMAEINDSARKIAEIISVIDEIAFQTNMLALNAAVEAARAGEHGRGFAVVAGEVGSLAKRSAQAAREIKNLIVTSVEKMEKGARLADGAGSSMQRVMQAVSKVDSVIKELSGNARAQQEGIRQIHGVIQDLDKIVSQNSELAEQSRAASLTLQQQNENLEEAIASFVLQDHRHASPMQRRNESGHRVTSVSPSPVPELRRAG